MMVIFFPGDVIQAFSKLEVFGSDVSWSVVIGVTEESCALDTSLLEVHGVSPNEAVMLSRISRSR